MSKGEGGFDRSLSHREVLAPVEVLSSPEVREDESRETRHYDYRDIEGRLLKATLVINTIPSDAEKEKFRLALAAQGESEFWAREYIFGAFPEKTTRKLESFVLTNEEGAVLDVFEECTLKEKSIILVRMGHAGALRGYEGLLVHEPEGPFDAFTFLHEFGHFEQVKDAVFVAEQEKLSKDSPRRSMSSPFVAGLEFDANRRAVEQAQDWKRRGFDITGFYPVDPKNEMIQEMLDQKGAEEIREQVTASGMMNINQFITLQLLAHRFSEE